MKRFLTSTAILCALGAQGQWLTDSLIAHFPMDGSPNDTVGGLVPVVTSGAPAFCADRFGNPDGAACFDGASFWSYGDVLDVDTTNFSIAYWVRLDTVLPPFYVFGNNGSYLSDASMLVGKGTTVYGYPERAGYSILAKNNGGVYSLSALWGGETNDLVYGDTPITLHSWFHVVQSRCGTQQTLYINGQLVLDLTTNSNRDLSVDIVFAVGALDRDPTNHPDQGWLHGALDDIRLYKGRCLSSAEIAVLADLNVGIAGLETTDQELQLSPNPATHTLRIDLTGSENITGPVLVLNAIGQTVPMANGSLGQTSLGVRSLTIDVSGLPNGAYFVVVPTEKGRLHGRFVKE